MKKKQLIITTLGLCIALSGIVGYQSYAGNLSFISSGRFEYDNATTDPSDDVIFDVQDLVSLDNKVESLASEVGNSKTDILNTLKTKNNPNFTVSDTASFADITNYISQIDTVPADTFYYVDGTEGDSATIERYKKIGEEYFACDANGLVADGISATDVTSKTLVPYTASVTGNLSAGSAGFSSGQFYLGDGSDNAAYYAQGVVDGMSEVLDNLDVQYTYHVHEGSEGTTANGCYTKAVYHSHMDSCYAQATGTIVQIPTYNDGGIYAFDYRCNRCNTTTGTIRGDTNEGIHDEQGQLSGTHNCGYSITVCGKTTDTVESYSLGCGKTEETVESVTITY